MGDVGEDHLQLTAAMSKESLVDLETVLTALESFVGVSRQCIKTMKLSMASQLVPA